MCDESIYMESVQFFLLPTRPLQLNTENSLSLIRISKTASFQSSLHLNNLLGSNWSSRRGVAREGER
jgi:hypothetical protein